MIIKVTIMKKHKTMKKHKNSISYLNLNISH